MLEFLGDLGGFLEAIQIVFSLVGTYFSSRFLKANFIEKFFKRKVYENSCNKEAFKRKNAKSGFQKIQISTFHILLEPVIE